MILYTDKLRAIRRSKKVTISKLADKMNISRNTLSDWEHGKRIPSTKKIRALAETLGIPASDISNIEVNTPDEEILTYQKHSNKELFLKEINTINDKVNNLVSHLDNNDLIINALKKATSSMIYIRDENLNFTLVNDEFLRTVAVSPEIDIDDKDDSFFFAEQEAIENKAEDISVIKTGNSIKYEGYVPGTRKTKWGIISKEPLLNNDDEIVGVVGSITDVTEQRLNKLQKIILNDVIDTLNYGVSVITYKPKGRIFMNETYENIYGSTIENFDWLSHVHPDDYEREKANFENRKWPETDFYKIINKKTGKILHIKQYHRVTSINGIDYHMFIEEDITSS